MLPDIRLRRYPYPTKVLSTTKSHTHTKKKQAKL